MTFVCLLVGCLTSQQLTYLLMPIAPSGAWAINDPPPSHSVLGCSCHSGPVGPLLFQLCFSVSPPTVARPASLPLPLRVPGQGLACGAGCWLPTSQQHASVSQGRICTDNFTCCHTEIEAADQTFHLTQSQYTDTGPTSPSADPITPGAWQGNHWSANV